MIDIATIMWINTYTSLGHKISTNEISEIYQHYLIFSVKKVHNNDANINYRSIANTIESAHIIFIMYFGHEIINDNYPKFHISTE
jgi:hypothetical protein